jgi:UDP-glucose 4-epimerase
MSHRIPMNEPRERKTSAAPQRITVLGGAGFLGSHICRELVACGYAVRIFEKTYASRLLVRDFEAGIQVCEGDISKPDDVLRACADAEVIINLVHTTVPGSSMTDPSFDIETNLVAAERWLRKLNETSVRRVYYVSSGGTVYGIPQTNLVDESHPTNPICSYGITKLSIEKYLQMYASLYGFDAFVLRPSNVYGPGQRLNIGQGVIGVLADRAIRGLPLEVWGHGNQLRDYLYVDDLVEAIMVLLRYSGGERTFNISSGQGHSVLEILDSLAGILGSLPEIRHTPVREFDVPGNVLDSSRLRTETGWQPSVALSEGIARTVEWLRSAT